MELVVQIMLCQALYRVLTRALALYPLYSSEVNWRATGTAASDGVSVFLERCLWSAM